MNWINPFLGVSSSGPALSSAEGSVFAKPKLATPWKYLLCFVLFSSPCAASVSADTCTPSRTLPAMSSATGECRAAAPDAAPDSLLRLADACRAAGLFVPEVLNLERALSRAEPGSAAYVLIHARLSELYSAPRCASAFPQRPQACERSAEESAKEIDANLARARELKRPQVLAKVLLSSANARLLQGLVNEDDNPKTLDLYRRSAHAALAAKDPGGAAQALLNRADVPDSPELAEDLNRAHDYLMQVTDPVEQAFLLAAAGARAVRAGLPEFAASSLNAARESAESRGDDLLAMYANGYLGELYFNHGRYAEALVLARRAVITGQARQTETPVYRWHWLAGRALAAQGDTVEAITAYRQAIVNLGPVQRRELESDLELELSESHFKHAVAPVYYELAELLAVRAERESAARAAWLRQTQEVLEVLKTLELRNFFQDECIAAQRREASFYELPAGIALLYPVRFEKRLALLLALPEGRYELVFQSVSEVDLETRAENFALALQDDKDEETFLSAAQALYDIVLRPLRTELDRARIHALLYDGREYLIDRYALAMVPGLRLTEISRAARNTEPSLLLAGISESLREHIGLPHVPAELENIGALFRNRETLLNRTATVESLAERLRGGRFDIVHFATHGHFTGDPENNRLLAYDADLTLDRLERLWCRNAIE